MLSCIYRQTNGSVTVFGRGDERGYSREALSAIWRPEEQCMMADTGLCGEAGPGRSLFPAEPCHILLYEGGAGQSSQ